MVSATTNNFSVKSYNILLALDEAFGVLERNTRREAMKHFESKYLISLHRFDDPLSIEEVHYALQEYFGAEGQIIRELFDKYLNLLQSADHARQLTELS